MLLNYCWTLSSNTKQCVRKSWKKSLCYLTFSGGLIQFSWILFLENKLFKQLSAIYEKKKKPKKPTKEQPNSISYRKSSSKPALFQLTGGIQVVSESASILVMVP